ncbi:hypothetical protein G7Z17_g3746 [Cylindrodendrum hubeiense]|uniref:Uncharacterized protein n=1 Tax=Cylindrodendrum hubeiense TaxID=595255 RepID=A0A9P5HF91_9HYPO|nr:hypothetical protein G7Z17_g3746 [Cylindrodendrum hubeiense]
MADLRRMQEQVGLTLQDSGTPQTSPSADSDSVSDSRSLDMGQENLEDISTYIACLMDLSQAVEHPAMDLFDDPDEESQQEAELFDVSTPQALSYYKTEGDLDNNSMMDPPTESLFSSTNPRLTETTKSTMQTESSLGASPYPSEGVKGHLAPSAAGMIARSRKAAMKSPSSLDCDDTASVATFASYSTTASALSQGRPRIPPMPEGAETSDMFDCPACWRGLRGPMTRVQWNTHLREVSLAALPHAARDGDEDENIRDDDSSPLSLTSDRAAEIVEATAKGESRADEDNGLLNPGISRLDSPVLPPLDDSIYLVNNVNHKSSRGARLDEEAEDNGDDLGDLFIMMLPCELYIYSRCKFTSTNFDQVVDWQEYDDDASIGEPAYLNIHQFHERLDHIADHFANEGRRIEEARPSSGLLEWLGPEPEASPKLVMTRLCTSCGTTSIWDPEMVTGFKKECVECDVHSEPQLMYQYSSEIPQGLRCATEPFGGPECDHRWSQAGRKHYCVTCKVAIDPSAWDHMWIQHARGGWTACCYCGIMLMESSPIDNNSPPASMPGNTEQVSIDSNSPPAFMPGNTEEVSPGTVEHKETTKKGVFSRLGERFKRR